MALLVFAMHVFAGGGWWEGTGGEKWVGVGGVQHSVSLSLTVSQGNYTPATIVCEDALWSNHLIADMADDETEILQG